MYSDPEETNFHVFINKVYVPNVRTPFPKFGHLPVKLNSYFLHGENNLQNVLLVLKLFQLSNGDFLLEEFFVAVAPKAEPISKLNVH